MKHYQCATKLNSHGLWVYRSAAAFVSPHIGQTHLAEIHGRRPRRPYLNICPVVKPQDTMVQWTAEERAAIEAVFAKLDYESVGRESLTR